MKYPLGLLLEDIFTTSSGKSYKYELMTGIHDSKRLDLSPMLQNKNTPLTVRNLKMMNGSEWQTVTHFGFMSSKEASEIRKRVFTNDPEFNPIVSGNCGYCGKPFSMLLFGMPDFFWPGETI
jgi:hypothetical protein